MSFYERNHWLFIFRNYSPTWLTVHLLLEGAQALESLMRGYPREYVRVCRPSGVSAYFQGGSGVACWFGVKKVMGGF